METPICPLTELFKIVPGENSEYIVPINAIAKNIVCEYDKEKLDMIGYFDGKIAVRITVANMLKNVSEKLSKKYPGFKLKVVYGYRHPDIQLKYYERRRLIIKKENPRMSDDELNEKTHMFVADPRVAGHPTGGAVDLTITTPDGDLDMGTKIADFEEKDKIKTFSDLINEDQRHNRMLLHDLMVMDELVKDAESDKFAPFYGEWWHFSYGDVEWACFYKQASSKYSHKNFHCK